MRLTFYKHCVPTALIANHALCITLLCAWRRAAADIDEIIAAVVGPRWHGSGRAFARTGGAFFAVADGLNASRIDAERHQKFFSRLRAPLAQTDVVFFGAARIAVAFNAEGYCAVRRLRQPRCGAAQAVLRFGLDLG